MEIIPAIDLINGRCVRLVKGDFDAVTVYEDDPVAQAQLFAQAGAKWMHVVDLDGARDQSMSQFDIIKQISINTPLKIQSGGGIRDIETARKLFDAGVARIVIGSMAVTNIDNVCQWLDLFGPDRITAAFDVRYLTNTPYVATHGWKNDSKLSLWEILDKYKDTNLKYVLCTDIGRDGMLLGPNYELYKSISRNSPHLKILASGGISGAGDLVRLANIPVSGAVVGKAIYEGRIDLSKVLEQTRHVVKTNNPVP